MYQMLSCLNEDSKKDKIFVRSVGDKSYYDINETSYSFFESLLIILTINDKKTKQYSEMTILERICNIQSIKTGLNRENKSINQLEQKSIQTSIFQNDINDELLEFCSRCFKYDIHIIENNNVKKIETGNKEYIIFLLKGEQYYPVVDGDNSVFNVKNILKVKSKMISDEDVKEDTLILKPIKNYLLKDLQQLAKENGIDISKISDKTGKSKSKTKSELYAELSKL
jgi:hypothetical protein